MVIDFKTFLVCFQKPHQTVKASELWPFGALFVAGSD